MKFAYGLRVDLSIAVVDRISFEILIDRHMFHCTVQPPPFSYDDDYLLEVRGLYLAKIHYIYGLRQQLKTSPELQSILEGKDWGLETQFVSKKIIYAE